jgi:hypothetical protein
VAGPDRRWSGPSTTVASSRFRNSRQSDCAKTSRSRRSKMEERSSFSRAKRSAAGTMSGRVRSSAYGSYTPRGRDALRGFQRLSELPMGLFMDVRFECRSVPFLGWSGTVTAALFAASNGGRRPFQLGYLAKRSELPNDSPSPTPNSSSHHFRRREGSERRVRRKRGGLTITSLVPSGFADSGVVQVDSARSYRGAGGVGGELAKTWYGWTDEEMRVDSDSGDFVSIVRAEKAARADNDILVAVEVRCRGLGGRIDTSIARGAWSGFCDQLSRLENGRKGMATVESIGPKELRLSILATRRAGHMAIEGFVGKSSTQGEALLSFSSMFFDASLLPDFLRAAWEIAG